MVQPNAMVCERRRCMRWWSAIPAASLAVSLGRPFPIPVGSMTLFYWVVAVAVG